MSLKLDRRELIVGAGALAAATAAGVAEPLRLQVGQIVEGGDVPATKASWFKKLGGKRIECQLCPRSCRVADKERGTCGVRENRGGTYYTLVWGLACSLNVDPVEKKPFFHVLPGEPVLSWATAGCNVECKFCQNWEISQFRPEQVRAIWVPPKEMVKIASSRKIPLLAATYSEPVVFWEYVRDVAHECKREGLGCLVVSNGYIQEQPLKEVLPYLAAYKVDLKAFTEKFYKEQVRGELKPVLDTLIRIKEAGTWLEIVVLLIPTLNDSEKEIRQLAKWVVKNLGRDVPVHFTRFHPTYRLTNLPATPVRTLETARKIAMAEGLNFVYVGNVPGHPGENTYCPGCGTVLIRRFGYATTIEALKNGRCTKCGREIPGVWRLSS